MKYLRNAIKMSGKEILYCCSSEIPTNEDFLLLKNFIFTYINIYFYATHENNFHIIFIFTLKEIKEKLRCC